MGCVLKGKRGDACLVLKTHPCSSGTWRLLGLQVILRAFRNANFSHMLLKALAEMVPPPFSTLSQEQKHFPPKQSELADGNTGFGSATRAACMFYLDSPQRKQTNACAGPHLQSLIPLLVQPMPCRWDAPLGRAGHACSSQLGGPATHFPSVQKAAEVYCKGLTVTTAAV